MVVIKKHCRRGHLLSEENTGWRSVAGKKRQVCRVCSNERVRRWRERHPEKRRREPTIDELMSRIEKESFAGCWLWQGGAEFQWVREVFAGRRCNGCFTNISAVL